MKNQKDLEEYLEPRGIQRTSYKILKERGTRYQDISIAIVIAKDSVVYKYNITERYWNRVTYQVVDSLVHDHYTKEVYTASALGIDKPPPNEDFENIK